MNRTRALATLDMVLAGRAVTGAVLLRAATLSPENPAAATAHGATLFDQQSVWKTWKIYCDTCHFGPKARAGLNLEALDLANLDDKRAVWEKLLRKLRNREMPPVGMPRPDAATYEALVKAIEGERDRVAQVKPNPGHPTLHRLNRAEYANVIRDLLAVEVDVAEMLPADDTGYGFDNIGDVLQVSPLLMERYLSAAGKISRLAVGDTTAPVSYQTYPVSHGLNQVDRMSEEMPLGSRGGTAVHHRFPVDGEYEISVGLARGKADEFLGMGTERKVDLRLDDQRLGVFTVAAKKGTQDSANQGVYGGFGGGKDPD